MWAITTLSCRLWLPATITATVRSNQRPFTVSVKHSRPRKNINYDYEDDEIENDRELEALKQQEIGDPDAYASNSEKISGSTILLALQKASAQKTSKKMKKKKKKKKSKNVNEEDDNRRNRDAIEDYSDVKPLCIKSDWKDRLDELETQLHHIIPDLFMSAQPMGAVCMG
ncbi:hypothetical protein L1987_06161 [Smallanthus sonchifolius]|uniref:Uncharacterized protein n=1 Tax=Smallanthus sonchifolius TaxID=185202 RepID=A0ACB9JXG3_9ASTR|nr:hypothetical protein L1987_06161 [Smallanthus sonchifolius]